MERWHEAQYIRSFSIISTAGCLYRPHTNTHTHWQRQRHSLANLSYIQMDTKQWTWFNWSFSHMHAQDCINAMWWDCEMFHSFDLLASCCLYVSSTLYNFVHILLLPCSALPVLKTEADILSHCFQCACVFPRDCVCVCQCVTVTCQCMCVCLWQLCICIWAVLTQAVGDAVRSSLGALTVKHNILGLLLSFSLSQSSLSISVCCWGWVLLRCH